MQLPDSVKAIRARYVAQYPVPQGEPGEAFEERARQWSIRFAEQVAFEQGPLWGMKRADPNRPISKDTITFYADETLRIWDLLTGTGTGKPRLVDNPESEDITGQVFVAVTPTNHLGVAQPPVVQPPALPPSDLGPVMDHLAMIASKLDTLQGHVDAVEMAISSVRASQQATVENFAGIGSQINAVSEQATDLSTQIGALAAKAQPIAWKGALAGRIRLTPEY